LAACFRLSHTTSSQTETLGGRLARFSKFGTPNFIRLTQIEITVYFSCIFNYL
jgi:hypothetical protein